MKNQKLKAKNSNLKCQLLVFNFQLLVIFALCGCAVRDFLMPERPPYDAEIAQSYSQTELKISTSADVLATIHKPEYELLSQSRSVIASVGQKKKGREIWLNMVAFDENELTARRKYFFIVDEQSKGFPFMRWRPSCFAFSASVSFW